MDLARAENEAVVSIYRLLNSAIINQNYNYTQDVYKREFKQRVKELQHCARSVTRESKVTYKSKRG